VIELNLLQIIGTAIGLIIAFVILTFLVFSFDVASYLATGSETLSPIGIAVGHALVVYNPGLSSAAKGSATKIAENLKAEGYTVDLAGIRSSAAAKSVDYDVVIVGSPVYWGKLSSLTGVYLNSLSLKNGAKLGIFGTTGSNQYVDVDFKTVSEQVSSLIGRENVPIKLILTGEVDVDCAALVSATVGIEAT
jgi:hypothetical protein